MNLSTRQPKVIDDVIVTPTVLAAALGVRAEAVTEDAADTAERMTKVSLIPIDHAGVVERHGSFWSRSS